MKKTEGILFAEIFKQFLFIYCDLVFFEGPGI